MRIHRVIAVSVFIMSSLLLCFSIGCSGNGTDGDGNGNGEVNGDSAIVGEIVGILTYGTTIDYMPPNNTPVPRTTLEDYSAAIEDKDGNVLLLSAPGMSSDFEWDGMFLSRVTTTVAGYTYADEAPFNDESRDVWRQTTSHQSHRHSCLRDG